VRTLCTPRSTPTVFIVWEINEDIYQKPNILSLEKAVSILLLTAGVDRYTLKSIQLQFVKLELRD